jgi:hypothetical protein
MLQNYGFGSKKRYQNHNFANFHPIKEMK